MHYVERLRVKVRWKPLPFQSSPAAKGYIRSGDQDCNDMPPQTQHIDTYRNMNQTAKAHTLGGTSALCLDDKPA